MKSKSRLSEVSLSVYYLPLERSSRIDNFSYNNKERRELSWHENLFPVHFNPIRSTPNTHNVLDFTMERVALEWVHAKSVISVCCSVSRAKQNKLHKNGSIWVESNASKWKGKCGRFKSPKECMQIVQFGFTDSALSSAPSLLSSRVLNRSTANRLQRYKAISRSIHTSISRHSPYSLSLVDVCMLFTDNFFLLSNPQRFYASLFACKANNGENIWRVYTAHTQQL